MRDRMGHIKSSWTLTSLCLVLLAISACKKERPSARIESGSSSKPPESPAVAPPKEPLQSAEQVLLLGLRDSQVPSKLSTVEVNQAGIVELTAKGILVPADSGFWLVQVIDGAFDQLVAWRVGSAYPSQLSPSEMDDSGTSGDYFETIDMKVLGVGDGFVSYETHHYACGPTGGWDSNGLYVLSLGGESGAYVRHLEGRHLSVEELLGPAALRAFPKEIEAYDVMEKVAAPSVGLVRWRGGWIARSIAGVGRMGATYLTVNVKVPENLMGTAASASSEAWRLHKELWPSMSDIVLFPSGDLAAIVVAGGLKLVRGDKVLSELRLPGVELVMVQWWKPPSQGADWRADLLKKLRTVDDNPEAPLGTIQGDR